MDSVILDGVNYVKASVVARDFKYTSDYIGQLCRAKKIDARLVGRTWFVNPESVTAHKSTKYTKTQEEVLKNVDNKEIEIKPARAFISSVIKNKTLKSVFNTPIQKDSSERLLKVSYELDDEALIPALTRKKSIVPKNISIKPADAKKIRIKKYNRTSLTNFRPDELPEVSLSGKLNVEGLKESTQVEDNIENNYKNIAKSDSDINESIKDKKQDSSGSPRFKKKHDEDNLVRVQPQQKQVPDRNRVNKVEINESLVSFTPSGVAVSSHREISIISSFSPLIAILLAAICVTILLSSSTNVVASGNSYESDLVLQMANLLELIKS